MNPSPAFDILYDGAMQKVFDRITALLHIITGNALVGEDLHVRCVSLIDQVFAFRFARAGLVPAAGWSSVGPHEADRVRRVVMANVRAILTDLTGSCGAVASAPAHPARVPLPITDDRGTQPC